MDERFDCRETVGSRDRITALIGHRPAPANSLHRGRDGDLARSASAIGLQPGSTSTEGRHVSSSRPSVIRKVASSAAASASASLSASTGSRSSADVSAERIHGEAASSARISCTIGAPMVAFTALAPHASPALPWSTWCRCVYGFPAASPMVTSRTSVWRGLHSNEYLRGRRLLGGNFVGICGRDGGSSAWRDRISNDTICDGCHEHRAKRVWGRGRSVICAT